MELKGKCIVVTGGGSGIGAGLVQRFAQEGAAGIVVADLDGARAQAVVDTVKADFDGNGLTDTARAYVDANGDLIKKFADAGDTAGFTYDKDIIPLIEKIAG